MQAMDASDRALRCDAWFLRQQLLQGAGADPSLGSRWRSAGVRMPDVVAGGLWQAWHPVAHIRDIERQWSSFRREDIQNGEVHPEQAFRVWDFIEQGLPNVFGWVLQIFPPGPIRRVTILETNRGGFKSLSPFYKLIYHLVKRFKLLAVIHEEDSIAFGGRHPIFVPMFEE